MAAEVDGRIQLEKTIRSTPDNLHTLLAHELRRIGHHPIYEPSLQDAARYAGRI
jgi:hypothetical protein